MSKLALTLSLILSQISQGAVIFSEGPKLILPGSNFFDLDLDGDGSIDLGVERIESPFTVNGVTGPETTSLLVTITTTFAGIAPLESGFTVGPSLRADDIYFDLGPESRVLLVSSVVTGGGERIDRGPFMDTTAFFGFSFEGDAGLHYGYVQVRGNPSASVTVLNWAYESEVNTPIVTGAIPEPSSALLMTLVFPIFLRRRR